MAVGKNVLVNLGLDVHPLDAGVIVELIHVNFIVEMADIAHDRLVLHRRHVVDGDDVAIAGRSRNVGKGKRVFNSGYLDTPPCTPAGRKSDRFPSPIPGLFVRPGIRPIPCPRRRIRIPPLFFRKS